MATLNVGGTRVAYRETGSGPPVVLLHGGGSSGAQWKAVCERLAPRYRTVTVDHYGHGGTDPWPGAPEARSHDAEAALVRAVIERLGEPVHLVGHSYGGGVAVRFALRHRESLRSLTLLEPIALSLLERAGERALAEGYRQFARAFIRDVAAGDVSGAWQRFLDGDGEPGGWAALTEAARAKFLGLTGAVVSCWYANLSDDTTLEECRTLTLPALLLYGERTRPHFRRIAELLAELLPAARLQVLPGAGHLSPLTHPALVAAALAPHLDAA